MIVVVAVGVEANSQGALMATWESWSVGMIWSWVAFAGLVVVAKNGLFESLNTGKQSHGGGRNTREVSARDYKVEGLGNWWENMRDREMWSVMNSKGDRMCF